MAHIKAKCDFCDEQAVYDAKTLLGPFAYVCQRHFNMYCRHEPGMYTTLGPVDIPVNKKQCSRCGKLKPFSEYYEYTDRHGTRRLRSECKECNLRLRSEKRRIKNGS